MLKIQRNLHQKESYLYLEYGQTLHLKKTIQLRYFCKSSYYRKMPGFDTYFQNLKLLFYVCKHFTLSLTRLNSSKMEIGINQQTFIFTLRLFLSLQFVFIENKNDNIHKKSSTNQMIRRIFMI